MHTLEGSNKAIWHAFQMIVRLFFPWLFQLYDQLSEGFLTTFWITQEIYSHKQRTVYICYDSTSQFFIFIRLRGKPGERLSIRPFQNMIVEAEM